jgi:hypothetical protein
MGQIKTNHFIDLRGECSNISVFLADGSLQASQFALQLA